MENLFISGDYHWSLFLGHLVIEKLLKAIFVKKLKKQAIFSHDLLRIIRMTGLEISNEQEEWFDKITTFNLNTRYDDYKQKFRKICNKEFTNEWNSKIKELRKWLISQL